ncbi:hypothetical protein V9T40_007399 [Parthenolecanium corni]|uniref:Tubulin--tyrosine ligase-like protein 5 n=1 Tax=Parthenolecanium corni TaxID=536013 RepID=A0AAN9YAQ9_9HEMI
MKFASNTNNPCSGRRLAPSDTLDFNLLWTGSHVKPQVLRNLLPHQRLNHFPRSYELTRKDRLYKNIEQMQYSRGLKHFDFVPQTFILPAEINELVTSHYRHRGAWIVKPIASSRGRGIYLVNSVEDLPLQENVVVAKYIENPLLVNGCKCDLRLYVVVTSYNPLLVYLYEEGLVRFATVKYDLKEKNLWNPCMHLCNYSINKHHSDYIKSSDPDADDVGHKWSLSALLKHLKSENHDTGLLMRRIEEMIVKAILATAPPIVTACRLFVPYVENCFELYGFDVLVDFDLKPWLLEVNLSPSLGCDSPLDTRLKSAMLSDLLTLIGIPAVDPVTRPKSTSSRKRNLSLARQLLSTNTIPYARNLTKKSKQANGIAMTVEEAKLMRIIRDQFDRKGGFVRIFPSADSWKKYSKYLDPVSGIPSFGTIPYCGQIMTPNYNQMVHQYFFSSSVLTVHPPATESAFSVLSESFDRLTRYERSLSNRYRQDFEMEIAGDTKIIWVTNRRLKAKWLTSGCEQRTVSEVTEMSFLRRNQRSKISNNKPSKLLKGNDKIAITAKHLSDFLFFYVQESKCVEGLSRDSSTVPEDVFTAFLKHATEHDIEEILNMNVKLRSSEMQPNRTVRISKLSLFQAFKRAENIVLSKVTNSSSNGEMNSI